MQVPWRVDVHDDFVPEYHGLHEDVQDELLARGVRLIRCGRRFFSWPATSLVLAGSGSTVN